MAKRHSQDQALIDRVRRRMQESLSKNPYDEAIEALNLLPGVCQSIKAVALSAARCKEDSPLGIKRWETYEKLSAEACELSDVIRDALKLAKRQYKREEV